MDHEPQVIVFVPSFTSRRCDELYVTHYTGGNSFVKEV